MTQRDHRDPITRLSPALIKLPLPTASPAGTRRYPWVAEEHHIVDPQRGLEGVEHLRLRQRPPRRQTDCSPHARIDGVSEPEDIAEDDLATVVTGCFRLAQTFAARRKAAVVLASSGWLPALDDQRARARQDVAPVSPLALRARAPTSRSHGSYPTCRSSSSGRRRSNCKRRAERHSQKTRSMRRAQRACTS